MRSLAMWMVEIMLIAAFMMVMLLIGIYYGEQQGFKKALNTNPVSDDLELVCAGLWVGEQNKKANK